MTKYITIPLTENEFKKLQRIAVGELKDIEKTAGRIFSDGLKEQIE